MHPTHRTKVLLVSALICSALFSKMQAADETVTGNLSVTGLLDVDGNSVTFGTQSGSFGAGFTYTDHTTDTLRFFVNRAPGSWLWENGAGVAMRLSDAHKLSLYKADGTAIGASLDPDTSTLALGSATLYLDAGILKTNSALAVGGAFTAQSYTASAGSITGGSSGLALNAGGADQNITLTPSGTGKTVITGNVNISGNLGVGTTNPLAKLHVYNASSATTFMNNSRLGLYVDAPGGAYAGIDFANAGGGGNSYPKARIAMIETGDGSFLHMGTTAGWTSGITNTALTINPAGNVGVNITNPTTKFEVAGSTAGQTIGLKPSSNTKGGVGFAIRTDTSYDSHLDVANGLTINLDSDNNNANETFDVFSGTGVNLLRVQEDGLVGIGTNAPSSPLDVQALVDGSAPAGLIVRRNTNQFVRIHEAGGGQHAIEAVDPSINQKPLIIAKVTTGGAPVAGLSDIRFGFTHDSGTGYSNASGYTAMSIQAGTANVGIGTTTPAAKLHIVQASVSPARETLIKGAVSDGGADAFFVGNGTALNGTYAPALAGYVDSTNTKWSLAFNGLVSPANDASDSSAAGVIDFAVFRTSSSSDPLNGTFTNLVTRKAFTFRVGPAETGADTALTILANKNVGIGTTAPSSKLEVYGNSPLLTVRQNPELPGGATLLLTAAGGAADANAGTVRFEYAGAIWGRTDSTGIRFGSFNKAETWMTLHSSGNVGIGTTDPTVKLDVVGNAKITGNLNVTGSLIAPGYAASGGTITGSTTSGLTLTAASSGNQNVVLTPSGTGSTILNGNIGIGTTAPSTKLQVSQTAASMTRETLIKGSVSDGGSDAFFIGNGTLLDNVFAPVLAGYVDSTNARWSLGFNGFVSPANDVSDSSDTGVVDFLASRTSNPSNPTNGTLSDLVNRKAFTFRTGADPGVADTALTILANKNIGVGTTAPTARLQVEGTMKVSGATRFDGPVRIEKQGDLGMGDFISEP